MKRIKLTDQDIEQAAEEFKRQASLIKTNDNTIDFKFNIDKAIESDKKPKVIFVELAARKINTLIRECDKEIAWHMVTSYDPETETYTVYDCLVYPQLIAGATVDADEDKYDEWLNGKGEDIGLPDEIFNNLRGQGHSHVNFGASPSGTDTKWYDELLKDVDDYYIFMIRNKSGAMWLNIYNVLDNIIYENEDIDFEFPEEPINEWYKENFEKYVKEKSYSYQYTSPYSKQKSYWEDNEPASEIPAKKKKRGRPNKTYKSDNTVATVYCKSINEWVHLPIDKYEEFKILDSQYASLMDTLTMTKQYVQAEEFKQDIILEIETLGGVLEGGGFTDD